MDEIDDKELLKVQTMAINNALLHPSTILPIVDENKNVLYQLITAETSTNINNNINVDILNIPIVGGNYNFPTGNYLTIASSDPIKQTIKVTGVIAIEGDGGEYRKKINSMYQNALKDLQKKIDDLNDELNIITNEQMLINLLTDLFATIDIWGTASSHSVGHLFFIELDPFGKIPIMKNMVTVFYLGFVQTSLIGQLFSLVVSSFFRRISKFHSMRIPMFW
jgi:hypothetical protein